MRSKKITNHYCRSFFIVFVLCKISDYTVIQLKIIDSHAFEFCWLNISLI